MLRIMKTHKKLSDYYPYPVTYENGGVYMTINLGKNKSDSSIDKHTSVISLLLKGYSVAYWIENEKREIIVRTTLPFEKYITEFNG